jgi:hypothetical protein
MKKNKTIELDVDFIGGPTPFTKEEENLIATYLKKRKLKSKRILKPTTRNTTKRKVKV